MYPRRRQTEQDIACFYTGGGNELGAFCDTHGEPCNIVFSYGIKPRHLRCFAADQGTAGLLAGTRNTCNDLGDLYRLEFADGKIVEEEKRFCPLHENIVDAHRDCVLPNCIVFVQ